MDIKSIFDDFSNGKIFRDRVVLSDTWIPNKELVVHRTKEIREIARTLAPLLRGDKPNNIVVYGKSGTGKTTIVLLVKNELEQRIPTPFKISYIKCAEHSTEFLILSKICETLRLDYKGTRTNKHYELIRNYACDTQVLLILDEINKLKQGNNVVFNLTRIHNVSIMGISNNFRFEQEYMPETKSSFSPLEIMFRQYNSTQIIDILKKRCKIAFNTDVVEPGVIEKCSALIAQEHGDARKALTMIKIAGEICEEEKGEKIKIEHIDKAEEKIDTNIILDYVKSCTTQSKLILYSVITLHLNGHDEIESGEVYSEYENLCRINGARVLTLRRVSDLLSELDSAGIINMRIIYKGAYGRTREIKLPYPKTITNKINNILKESF